MQKMLSTLAALLMLGTMLTGCASREQEIASGVPTPSITSSAACVALEPIHPSRGKPQDQGPITTEEIAALLNRDHPIERVRNWVGDTSSTLTQIDRNNAKLGSLCGETNGAPPR